MTQPSIIDVIDSHVVEPAEQVRLAGQSARILAKLEVGPVSNFDLVEISLKYTSRISDIRRYLKPRGRNVKVLERDHATGRTLYGLVDL